MTIWRDVLAIVLVGVGIALIIVGTRRTFARRRLQTESGERLPWRWTRSQSIMVGALAALVLVYFLL